MQQIGQHIFRFEYAKFIGPIIAVLLLVGCGSEEPPQATNQISPPAAEQPAPKPTGNLGFSLSNFKTFFAKATKKGGLKLKIAKSEVDYSRAFTVNFNDESFMSGVLEPDSDTIIGLHVAGDGPPFMIIVATLIGISVVPDPDAQKYMQVLGTFAQQGDPQIHEGETELNGLRYKLHNLGNGYDFVVANKAREEAESAENSK